jgi:aldehyde:ferredoxin oxidoreductase
MSTLAGRLLRVDLSSRRISTEEIPLETRKAFVGGRGYGIAYLYRELAQGVEPLSAENKLIFVTGALGGSSAIGFGRWIVMTKSPLTGALARAVCGGNLAAYIKFAGYDLILIEGASDDPVYLLIKDSSVEIADAEDLWGLDTQQTQDALSLLHGRVQTACIGPAGENLVRYATITHGTRTASRCGVGTVMGSKKLKAVVFQVKAKRLTPFDPDRFRERVAYHRDLLKNHKRVVKMHTFGTTFLAEMTREMGVLPVKNFQAGDMEGIEGIFTQAYAAMRVGTHGCFNCITRCGQVHEVKNGPYKGAKSEGPEYETIWAFGSQVGNALAAATVKADHLCDRLGLDTISAGNTIGFAMELYQRGILTKQDCDGLELNWGNHEAMIALIKKIAAKEGIGKILGEGTKRAAELIGKGAEDFAIHVKGLELPAYEPRAAKIHGLSMATSNIGASHMYGYARQEISGKADPRPVDRFADQGNGDIAAYNQIDKAAEETAILCNFADSGMTRQLLGELLSYGAGCSELMEEKTLRKVGERIVCLERCFNVREGFSRKDDTLPKRMQSSPLENAGPATGQVVRNLDALLDEYYDALGYSRQGIPTDATLASLGLDSIVKKGQTP